MPAPPVVTVLAAAGVRRPVSRRTWPGAAAAASVAVPTAAVGLHALLYGRWIVDDAAITFAYARSLTTGWGPVLQPGAAPVEAWSNPAWLALLALGRWLGLFDRGTWFGMPDYVAYPKLLGLLCCAAMFTAFLVAARALVPRPYAVTAVAACAVAAVPSFVIWVMSGLENALLAATATWIAALLARAATGSDDLLGRRTAVTCGLLAALAALTRPDGAIYVLAYPLLVLVLRPRGEWRAAARAATLSAVACALPAGAYLTWRIATFGLLVPNTAVAKGQSLLPGPDAIIDAAKLVAYPGGVGVVFAVLVVAALLRRRPGHRRGVIALLIPLGAAVTAFELLQQDWMAQLRFTTPIWPLAILSTTVATALLWTGLAARGRRVVAAGVALSTVVAAVVFGVEAKTFRDDPTVPVCAVAATAGWNFNGYAAILGLRDATVVTPDVGGSALVSRLHILDVAGLADTGLARRYATRDLAGLRDDVFAARPEFLELHDSWTVTTGLLDDPRMAGYVEIRRSAPLDGVWVRRDLVRDADLAALRAYDRAYTAGAAEPRAAASPLDSCGDVLRA